MNMPRPDCEKLMELTKGVLNGYTLADPIWLGFQWVVNYRFYNLNTVVKSYSGGVTKNVQFTTPFLSIFSPLKVCRTVILPRRDITQS
mgnify:CR=1 FL=1